MTGKKIKQIYDLWEKEKEEYRTAEIGTGVQRFVKHIFECEELFNLAEGHLATADNKRKNEFITEAKKKGRRADVVIFLDSDIIIPVEIEKHTHINSGIQQIFNYQADWSKKLGILTDGNEWWFYNNRFVEKKFFINDILENPTNFLTYWKEYTTPDYYYRSFFEKKGQLNIFEEPAPELDNVREDFFLDITKLIENFENKLNLKGYFTNESDETEKKKKAIEISYAYLIQFILYKVLVDNAFADLENDWKQRLESIYKAIKAETYGDVLIKIKGVSDKISDKIYKSFNEEQQTINDKLKDILSAPRTEIADVSVWLDILLFINRYNFANVQNEIFGYVYENYLKDLYLNEKKGQYFTDPHVVEFMLNEIGYTEENLKNRYAEDPDSLSIVDPSCGSGTFLYNATNRIIEAFFDQSKQSSKLTEELINENIFGFDIAEFPLYLAEMNILMRMLPIIINENYNNRVDKKIKIFKTVDSIAEFLDTNIINTLSDIEVDFKKSHGQRKLFTDALDLGYKSFMRDKNNLDSVKRSLENNEKKRVRFDFVIGNPPYVGYNEISRQKLLFVKLMQTKKLQMNDIYGVNLNTVPGRPKGYSPKPNLYSFFIALGLALLKDNGKLCYIIPQTILTASDLDVIRYHLSNFAKIDKIINFSCKMFVGRGIKQTKLIPTSSLILIISKTPPTDLHETEIIHYNGPNDDVIDCINNITKGKKINKSYVLQNKLSQNIDNWNFIKFDTKFTKFIAEYKNFSNSIEEYRSSVLSNYDEVQFDKGFVFDRNKKTQDNTNDTFRIAKSSSGLSVNYEPFFINKKEFRIPQGSQGLSIFKNKYKIVWSYTALKYYYSEINNLMVGSNWLIISSENRNEILFLLSLLNSPLNIILLNSYLRLENEALLIASISSIKTFIRIPKITSNNEHIKKEVISSTIRLLEIEKIKISDLADFKGIMLQKFDKLSIIDNNLIINYKDKEAKCRINDKQELIAGIVSNIQSFKLFDDQGIGNVSELKTLPALDKELQSKLKDYIDDLVFALYFNIQLPDLDFENAENIKDICKKNKYYELVNSKKLN